MNKTQPTQFKRYNTKYSSAPEKNANKLNFNDIYKM